jgi:hypothetical protein
MDFPNSSSTENGDAQLDRKLRFSSRSIESPRQPRMDALTRRVLVM